jgi:hypothetical protein
VNVVRIFSPLNDGISGMNRLPTQNITKGKQKGQYITKTSQFDVYNRYKLVNKSYLVNAFIGQVSIC